MGQANQIPTVVEPIELIEIKDEIKDESKDESKDEIKDETIIVPVEENNKTNETNTNETNTNETNDFYVSFNANDEICRIPKDYFSLLCYNGELEKAKQLYASNSWIDITTNKSIFHWACKGGHLEVVQWLLETNPQYVIGEQEFGIACGWGYLNISKWFYAMKEKELAVSNDHDIDNDIDVLLNKVDDLFLTACEWGYLDVAQWLYSIKPSIVIVAKDNEIFRRVCGWGHLDVAQWLYAVCKEKEQDMDIHAKDNDAYLWAYYEGNEAITEWLLKLDPEIDTNNIVDVSNRPWYRS